MIPPGVPPHELRCAEKRSFRTRKMARREARRLRKTAIDWFRINVYYCPAHKGWHVGNRPLPRGFRHRIDRL